jgi:hypothetical protein
MRGLGSSFNVHASLASSSSLLRLRHFFLLDNRWVLGHFTAILLFIPLIVRTMSTSTCCSNELASMRRCHFHRDLLWVKLRGDKVTEERTVSGRALLSEVLEAQSQSESAVTFISCWHDGVGSSPLSGASGPIWTCLPGAWVYWRESCLVDAQ